MDAVFFRNASTKNFKNSDLVANETRKYDFRRLRENFNEISMALKSGSKAGTQACDRWLQITVYKTIHCSTEKTQRKGDSLKGSEGDSPQNQQKNGSSGFIKNEV